MPATADVVIIGAGAIGCSMAYHLARAGITDVLVVEMDQVGSGSSGKSASMLSLQFCADELSGEKGGLRSSSFEIRISCRLTSVVNDVWSIARSVNWKRRWQRSWRGCGAALADRIAFGRMGEA